jgi:hypothetical protein
VSAHLKVLADTGFVLVEPWGTARLYRVNEECVSCFPSAAEVVMGAGSGRSPRPPNPPMNRPAGCEPRRRAGFREIGIRERVGRHHGVRRDVVMIERRSERTGT